MPTLNPAKVIRRVRQRMELSQEGLSRLLNATKGAVQHWERGRNNPDLARLLALRQLCAAGPERRELDGLIRQAQAEVAPVATASRAPATGRWKQGGRGSRPLASFPSESFTLLRRENHRLRKQVEKLESTLGRRSEQVRLLEDLATDLQRQMAKLRASHLDKTELTPSIVPHGASS